MPRTWTPEQKKAASQAAKTRIRPSEADVYLAQNEGRDTTLKDVITTSDGASGVRHTTAQSITIYKRGNYGWAPTQIPSTNLRLVLGPEGQGNYATHCPECGGYCGEDGQSCPSRPSRLYRQCPIPSCRKKFWDTPTTIELEPNDDPSLIQDDAYLLSTPELRTKAQLDSHLFYYHPTESAALAPQSSRNPVQSPLAGRLHEVS